MRRRKIFAIFIVVFTVLLTSFSFYVYQILYTPNLQVEKNAAILYLPRNATFRSVQDSVYHRHIVNDIVSFSFLSKLMGYDELVKPGRYLIHPNMTNLEAIRMLRAGRQEPTHITFNNIRLPDELAEKITQTILLTPAEFTSALNDFIAHNQDGFNKDNILTMFIPNTYEVYWDISGKALIERMHEEYQRFWNPERKEKAKEIGLSPIEVSILASIVQAEASHNDESAEIAGLYMNRLNRNIALQADPTLVFASGDFSLKRVLDEHKKIDSPYNTYKYRGLPPGPINMPTIHSIDAVLNYQKHDYIYMCAKPDFSGYHNFSSSYQQHLVNAREYQRALTIEMRKANQGK